MRTAPPSNITGRVPIRIDVSEAFAEQVRAAARAEDRSVSNYLRRVLVKALEPRPERDAYSATAHSEVRTRADALHRAELGLERAKAEVEHANAELDAALSRRGWDRLAVIAHPGAVPIYASPLYPGASIDRPGVLRNIAAMDER